MRKLRSSVAVAALALAAFSAPAAFAADFPTYDIPPLPPVDYGLGGSFYLRGSAAFNMLWADTADYACGCLVAITQAGYGYSIGAGVGYETGDGLRFDVTVDYLQNNGLSDGVYTLAMRSAVALANVYYDFGFDDSGLSAAGGFGGYVGAGIGGAYNHLEVTGPLATPNGDTLEPAVAVMAGVTYDMGASVADLGYRGIYMHQLTNGDAATPPYYINRNMVHEIRGTLRYRLD